MKITNFRNYINNEDISVIPFSSLTGDTKNVFIKKGVIYSRSGMVLKGSAGSQDNGREWKAHSPETWNTTLGEERPLRVVKNNLQLFFANDWHNILTLDDNVKNVEYTGWIDANTNIVRDRFVFVDGSEKIYQWNGATAEVESISGNDITIKGDKTLAQLGFDEGDVETQVIIINGTEYTYTQSDLNIKVLTLNDTTGINAGDILVTKPTSYENTKNLSGFKKDFIWSYKNHLVTANLNSPDLWFSDLSIFTLDNGFDFEIPTGDNRTMATPFFVRLDAPIRLITEKRNFLFVSTTKSNFRIEKHNINNEYGFYIKVVKIDSGNGIGALPFAGSSFKEDVVYVAENKKIYSVRTRMGENRQYLDYISEPIQGLLDKQDLTGIKVKYLLDTINFIIPKGQMLLIYDINERIWQPPQTFALTNISMISNEIIGHSIEKNESYTLFSGGSDLDTPIEYKIEFGSQSLETSREEFNYKSISEIGFDLRTIPNLILDYNMDYTTGGSIEEEKNSVKLLNMPQSEKKTNIGLATNPYGTKPFGTGEERNLLGRYYLFSNTEKIQFYKWALKLRASGIDLDFRLLGVSIDISKNNSHRKDSANFNDNQKIKKVKKEI